MQLKNWFHKIHETKEWIYFIFGVHAQLCLTLCDPVDPSLPGFSVHGIFSDKNTGVVCYFLFQEIFPTQGSTLHLPVSPALAGRFFTTDPSGKPHYIF